MDSFQTEKIICPKCGHEQEVKIYPSINSSLDTDIVEKILTNQLFCFECDECHEKTPLIYNSLYHDIEHGLMVWLMPEICDEHIKEMNDTAFQLQAFGMVNPNVKYRYRIVRTVNELKEKMAIEKENLDDRILELLKVAYLVQIAEQIGDKTVAEMMFDCIDDGYFFTLFFENEGIEPAMIMIDMNVYKNMQEQFIEILDSSMPEGFIDISFDWAKDMFFNTKK